MANIWTKNFLFFSWMFKQHWLIRTAFTFIFSFLCWIVVHQNYVGIDSEKNPYFLSIVSHESGNKSTPLYRAMLFRKQVSITFEYFKFETIVLWIRADRASNWNQK